MALIQKRGAVGRGVDGWAEPVTVRLAAAGDRMAIERLAGRDSCPVPPEPLLVAERAGVIDAMLSLCTGAVAADPFRPTAELVELLRCHAARATSADRRARQRPSGRPRRTRRPRLAGAAEAVGCP